MHHKQQVLLYGTEFEKHQATHDVYGKPLPLTMPEPTTDKNEIAEHYWSEYRRNYEAGLRAKMEEDRLKIQATTPAQATPISSTRPVINEGT